MSDTTHAGIIGALKRADEALFTIARYVLTVLMATMTCAVMLQVATRYVFAFSLTWSEELARLCFVCLIFLATAVLARTEEHLAVTTFVAPLSARLKSVLALLANLVGLVCTGYLVSGSFRALNREWFQLTPAMQVPMGAVYLFVFTGVVLTMLALASNLLRHGLLVLREAK